MADKWGDPFFLVLKVYGSLTCSCGHYNMVEECTLPAYVECEKCKRFYSVGSTVVEDVTTKRVMREIAEREQQNAED